MTEEINYLKELYQEVIRKFDVNDINRNNLFTVKNFIDHIYELNESERAIVIAKLSDYLKGIKNNGPSQNRNETIFLFNEFLYPLTLYYSRIGFIVQVGIFSIIIVIAPALILQFFFNASIWWYLIDIAFSLVLWGRVYFKKKQGRIFGPNY